MHAPFQRQFQEALAELEALTAQLRSADPQDLERMTILLSKRRVVAEEVAAQAGEPGSAGRAEVERMRKAWQSGQLVEERLGLAAASIRQQLQELYRAGFHARVLASEWTSPGPPGVDIEV